MKSQINYYYLKKNLSIKKNNEYLIQKQNKKKMSKINPVKISSTIESKQHFSSITFTQEDLNNTNYENQEGKNKIFNSIVLRDVIEECKESQTANSLKTNFQQLSKQLSQLFEQLSSKTLQDYPSQKIYSLEKQILKRLQNLCHLTSKQQFLNNKKILENQKLVYQFQVQSNNENQNIQQDKNILFRCVQQYKQCGQAIIKGYFKGELFKMCTIGCREGCLQGIYLVTIFTLFFPLAFTIWLPWLLWRFIKWIVYQTYKCCCMNSKKLYDKRIQLINLTAAGKLLQIYKKYQPRIIPQRQTKIK